MACSLSLATLDDTGLASCSPLWPSRERVAVEMGLERAAHSSPTPARVS